MRLLLAIACLALLLASPSQSAAGDDPDRDARIVGGTLAQSPEEAPWVVRIRVQNTPDSAEICSGSLIAADRVLTAAHCAVEEGQVVAADAITLIAGTVDVGPSGDQSRKQERTPAAVRVHPAYRPGTGVGDVAQLTVAEPFDVSGPAVRTVAVAATHAGPPPGASLRVHGWGQHGEGPTDGKQRWLDTFAERRFLCANGRPGVFCARVETGETCHGDSGAGLIRLGSPPELVGVHSFGMPPDECAPGGRGGEVEVTAPAIQEWILGNDTPPAGPSATERPELSSRGGTLTCAAPAWSGSPAIEAEFHDADSGAILQRGPQATYTPARGPSARRVGCVSIAANAGGSAESIARTIVTVPPADPPPAPPSPPGSSAAGATPGADAGAASARSLVKARLTRARSGRFTVRLRVDAALVGKRARAVWRVARCKSCRGKPVAGRKAVKLRARTKLRSPTVPRGRWLRLTLDLPEVQRDGVTYAAGSLTTAPRRRAR